MIPPHWWLSGPSRHNAAERILRVRNVGGGHVSGLYRVLRIGPFGIYLMRYRPGHVDEQWRERSPVITEEETNA
jgi:hypothetical protein